MLVRLLRSHTDTFNAGGGLQLQEVCALFVSRSLLLSGLWDRLLVRLPRAVHLRTFVCLCPKVTCASGNDDNDIWIAEIVEDE